MIDGGGGEVDRVFLREFNHTVSDKEFMPISKTCVSIELWSSRKYIITEYHSLGLQMGKKKIRKLK